jgi:hypothetical protein
MFLVISGDSINILNHIRGMLMEDEFANLLINLRAEILFLSSFWRVVISLLSQVGGVFLTHHLDDVLLDGVDNKLLLLHGPVLDEGLHNTAAVMLVDQLLELLRWANHLDGLGHDRLLFLICAA